MEALIFSPPLQPQCIDENELNQMMRKANSIERYLSTKILKVRIASQLLKLLL